jgi:hypothetical protein
MSSFDRDERIHFAILASLESDEIESRQNRSLSQLESAASPLSNQFKSWMWYFWLGAQDGVAVLDCSCFNAEGTCHDLPMSDLS